MTEPRAFDSAAATRITLDQWRCLVAVVEFGGYAQAAEKLHISQSSVTYAVQKLESSLDVKAFELKGRKSALTPTGEMLYRRARYVLEEAQALERAAHKASAGWEAEISIAVEVIFPTWLLLDCMNQFGAESPQTRIEVFELVLGGPAEALEQGRVDLAVTSTIPSGLAGEPIGRARFSPVAHPSHPLHQLNREVSMQDLRKHRHIVVRDSSSRRSKRAFIEIDQRWTVSNMSTAIGAATRGYGFMWLPMEKIQAELADGSLKQIPLSGGSDRFAQLYLVYADREAAGPGAIHLGKILKTEAAKLQATHPQCG
jgi:DNA-binding transcriptional LysR family regulator